MDYENDFRFEVMTSNALVGKAPAQFDWAHFYSTFRVQHLTPRELAISIWRGFSFTPVWHSARREANFISAGHMAFDFDADGVDDEGVKTSSIGRIMADGTLAGMFGSFAYTTPSHTDEAPRARAVFILEHPITSAAEYRRVYQAMAWWITKGGSPTDQACKDPLRLYYGSRNATVHPNWQVLTDETIARVIEICDMAQPRPVEARPLPARVAVTPTASMQNAKLQQLGRKVKEAPKGEGHNTLLKVATVAGGYVAGGALNPADVEAELRAAAMSRQEPDAKEIDRTIRDGMAYGAARPLQFEGVRPVGDYLP